MLAATIGLATGGGAAEAGASLITQPPWTGRLAIAPDRKGFVDGAGRAVLPLCAHFGEAFSAFTRRPQDVASELRVIKQAGYDCVRFWDHLGEYSDGWRGREVSPFSWTNGDGVRVEATPRYYEQADAFVRLLGEVGLAADHSGGDFGRERAHFSVAQIVEMRERWAQIYDRHGWHLLALGEAVNEAWQNGGFGPRDLQRIVEPFARRGAIVGLSAPPPTGETMTTSSLVRFGGGASVFVVHGRRTGPPAARLHEIFSLGYEMPPELRLGWQTEPTGPGHGVTVNDVSDVEELGLLAAQSLMSRQAWTYMSGHGVFWNGPIASQPGFAVVPKVRAALAAFAPEVMSWRLAHGGRRDAAWCVPEGCRGGVYYGDPGVASGPARVDQAISADRRRVVAVVYGGRGERALRNHMPCAARVQLLAPRDDGTIAIEETTVPANEILPLPPYRIGRLLFATCQ